MTPPNPPTVMQGFATYVELVYARQELLPDQAKQLRQAFVAGAYFLLGLFHQYVGHEDVSAEMGEAALEAIKAECETFGAQVGTDQEPPLPARTDNVGEIEIGTILSMRTKRGIVELVVNGHKSQLDVAKAREVSHMLVEAIEAAVSDTVLFAFMKERVGLDDDKAARALLDFRELRQGSKDTVYPS